MITQKTSVLSSRWTPLRYHEQQVALSTSTARFNVAVGGRRSGKTERAKRKIAKEAIFTNKTFPCKFIAAAPTRDQAKRIYWEDFKALIPKTLTANVMESELTVELVNGNRIAVVGMDKPERVEGEPIDGIILDEYADMKPAAWTRSVRPALSTVDREGWAWFIGKPKGRNHFWNLAEFAKANIGKGWGFFTWPSSTILSEAEIISAKAEMDERSYEQEYNASFISYEGRAYYAFERHIHAKDSLKYDKRQPISFALDFNVSPGVAAIVQEQQHPVYGDVDGVIGEVWVPVNSNTKVVCQRLIKDWGKHEGRVNLYGDATGGAKGTAKVSGSDWDIVRDELKPIFGDRLSFKVPRKNPLERVRVNVMNARLRTADGSVNMLVDPVKAPHVLIDLEGVTTIEGGSGELDKLADPMLTHISDGLGYYVVTKYPPMDLGITAEEY